LQEALIELTPSSITGTVYNDLNNDGIKAITEVGIVNVTVNLTGTDYLGTNVSLTAITNTNGQYSFTNLRASNAQGYLITETQPTVKMVLFQRIAVRLIVIR